MRRGTLSTAAGAGQTTARRSVDLRDTDTGAKLLETAVPSVGSAENARWLEMSRQAAALIFGPESERHFAIRYWTGLEERPATSLPNFTLVLTHPAALRRMLLPPSELALGEAFVRGDFDVEGDFERAASLGRVIGERLKSPRRLARLLWLLLQLPAVPSPARDLRRHHASARHLGRRHARGRDAESVRYHYDVGNEFYELWLDREMVYSCAYFRHEAESLDEAQRAKLDLICRKLRLLPGERLLDVGCGWGGLIRYAARHYGVHALGITLSPAQASYARERIAAEGLSDRCTVEVRDYRDLAGSKPFDKIVSAGMVEHVGRRELPRYFRTLHDLAAPGGLFLNHGIVRIDEARSGGVVEYLARRAWRSGAFISRYVFPDGELLSLATMGLQAERAGWEQRDVESLREHYALTLRQWVRRLEGRASEAAARVGSPTFRVWRLYMAASAHAFSAGNIGVVQMLLARPDSAGCCRVRLTRDDIHARSEHRTPTPLHQG